MPTPEYALYCGDTFIDIGTISQLAEKQGVKPSTMSFYRTPSYIKRIERRKSLDSTMILIRIEDD